MPPPRLYAWPDIDAARRGKVLPTALRQRPRIDAATEEILGAPLPSSVVLAPGGVAQPGTLAALAAARATVVVLSDRAAPLVEPTYFTPSGNVLLPTAEGDLRALLADSGLSDTLALPMGTPAEQTAVRQALLAQTLVTAMELPETQRLVVTGPDPAWDPPAGAAEMVVTALTGAPWVAPDVPGRGTCPRAELTGPGPRRPDARAGGPGAAGRTRRPGARPVPGPRRVRRRGHRPGGDPRGDPDRPDPTARCLVPGPSRGSRGADRARRRPGAAPSPTRSGWSPAGRSRCRAHRGPSRSRSRTRDPPR